MTRIKRRERKIEMVRTFFEGDDLHLNSIAN